MWAVNKSVSLRITDAYRQRFPDLDFGIGTIQSCTYFEKSESFKLFKRELLRKMRRKGTLAQLEEGIVCSLFQGPDFRTRVEPVSQDIVVYIFTAPGIQEEQVSGGLQLALEILEKFGYVKDSWWEIYRP